MEAMETLTPSLEDYLEAILTLERKNRVARVKDIAELLRVQMPSVTGALKTLKKKGYINYEKNSFISLTSEGMGIANLITDRHEIITEFLSNVLLLPREVASGQACKIEHVINEETARRLKNCTDYLAKEVVSKNWDHIVTR
jgi:DtxR family Mn-dependent transcriptional regulator